MRAFITTFVAACLLVAVAEGYVERFPNFAFPRFPGVSFRRLPVPQPPRLPGPFQPPPLPQPPLIPVFGHHGFPNIDLSIPYPILPDVDDLSPDSVQRGGSFSGFSVSSSSNGQDGVTIVTVNENGEKHTYINPSPPGGAFFSIPSSPPGKPPGLRMAQVMRSMMRKMHNTMQRAFGIPRFPEFNIPEFPKFKHIDFKPLEFKPVDFKPIEIKPTKINPIHIEPIDIKAGPSSSGTFEAQVVGSTYHMSSENGGKPKIVSEVHSIVNKDGKVEKKVFKYEN